MRELLKDKCGGGDLLVRAMVRAGNSLLHLAQSLLQQPIWRYGHSRCALQIQLQLQQEIKCNSDKYMQIQIQIQTEIQEKTSITNTKTVFNCNYTQIHTYRDLL